MKCEACAREIVDSVPGRGASGHFGIFLCMPCWSYIQRAVLSPAETRARLQALAALLPRFPQSADGFMLTGEVISAAVDAVLLERERCAKVAKEYRLKRGAVPEDAEAIAAKIREVPQ